MMVGNVPSTYFRITLEVVRDTGDGVCSPFLMSVRGTPHRDDV